MPVLHAFPYLEGSVGQKGEPVLLEEALTDVDEDGISDSLGEEVDTQHHIISLWSLLNRFVEYCTKSLQMARNI